MQGQEQSAEQKTKASHKLLRRLWASLLALIIPGLGQAFNREYARELVFGAAFAIGVLWMELSGAVWRFSSWLSLRLFILGLVATLIVMIWAAIDGFLRSDGFARRRAGKLSRYSIDAAFIIGWLLLTTVSVPAEHFKPFYATSASMLPTVESGDSVFVIDRYYNQAQPTRGDLVVFKLPGNPSIDFVKRVVGLPGDRVQMKKGVLYINGVAATREPIEHVSYPRFGDGRLVEFTQFYESMSDGARYRIIKLPGEQPFDNTPVFEVPPGRYFMLGDNRDNSADSRDSFSGVGFVPADHLVGRVAFIYFSWQERQRNDALPHWLPVIRWSRIGLALE